MNQRAPLRNVKEHLVRLRRAHQKRRRWPGEDSITSITDHKHTRVAWPLGRWRHGHDPRNELGR